MGQNLMCASVVFASLVFLGLGSLPKASSSVSKGVNYAQSKLCLVLKGPDQMTVCAFALGSVGSRGHSDWIWPTLKTFLSSAGEDSEDYHMCGVLYMQQDLAGPDRASRQSQLT